MKNNEIYYAKVKSINLKTGKVQNKVRYKNEKQIGLYAVIEGSVGSEVEGWNENDLYFYGDQLNVVDAGSGESTSTTKN